MKLYRVTCRGMRNSVGTQPAHGVAYVVAPDPTSAYQTLRDSLDRRKLGFEVERELHTIELIADEGPYPKCGHELIIKGEA